jgi:hypothetical protein
MEYVPPKNSYGIRIFDSIPQMPIPNLVETKNWIDINNYYFNDGWPKSWKEYSWMSEKDWENLLKIDGKNYPKMTKESLQSYYESRGHPFGRGSIFTENDAKKILNDFEKFKNNIENVMIHCVYGKNRSSAIGKAMNEIYGWEIKDLEEKFPMYRRYVYDVMMKVGKRG